jgi:23S rRNA (cytosine1962-C5)-methyltransferase
MKKIILKKGKEQSVKRRHPWIFSGAIDKADDTLADGDVAHVYSAGGEALGTGHFQIGSIAVRLLSFSIENIDTAFYARKIEAAAQFRRSAGFFSSAGTNVFRLLHGEGDGLPGLVADYYDTKVVMQCHSVGMYLQRSIIAEAMQQVLAGKLMCLYNKSSSTVTHKAGLDVKDEFLIGSQTGGYVLENGSRFYVDWVEGQKTGFFIDQRENRQLVKENSAGKDVLNVFCYTGGFSVAAAAGGAKSVASVDISKKAVELTDANMLANPCTGCRHSSYAEDAFAFMARNADSYDLIVLDPPAFAKRLSALENALQAYKRINQRAIETIRPGGLLFTYSCSQVVSKQEFRKSVFAAAANAGRNVRVLRNLEQPPDHPVSIYHPEGEYLKGLLLYIE